VRAVSARVKGLQMLIPIDPFTLLILFFAPPSTLHLGFVRHVSCQPLAFTTNLLRTAMSPYRQSALRGAFSGSLFHGARRLVSNALYVVPPVAIGQAVFTLVLHAG